MNKIIEITEITEEDIKTLGPKISEISAKWIKRKSHICIDFPSCQITITKLGKDKLNFITWCIEVRILDIDNDNTEYREFLCVDFESGMDKIIIICKELYTTYIKNLNDRIIETKKEIKAIEDWVNSHP